MNSYDSIPEGLRRLDQWVLWQIEYDKYDKPTKRPYQAANWRRFASHNDRSTWASFDMACSSAEASGMGIGFVFTKDDGFFGIDVDPMYKVKDDANDTALELRAQIHEAFPTYCELSPSKQGRHYIGWGAIPENISAIKDSKYQIEIYDHLRFFTITGQIIDGRQTLADCQESLNELTAAFAPSQRTNAQVVHEIDDRSVDDIINYIRGWANGAGFAFMMDAPLPDILARYRSDHSGADMALLNYIGVATKDPDLAVQVFRRSPLWRGTKDGYTSVEAYTNKYLIGFGLTRIWEEQAIKDEQRKRAAEQGAEIAARLKVRTENEETGETPVDNKYNIILPHVNLADDTICFPPGMMGEFVKSVHDATFTPNIPYSLAVSFAYLSGLCGRGFRFGRSGCNVFTLVAGKSATGKSQSIDAMEHLISRVTSQGDMEKPPTSRIITAAAKTAQGIYDHFNKTLSGAWITDECASMLSSLTRPVSNGDHELKDSINRLYDAAVPGKKWALSASRASNDKKGITCLSIGVAWFTTIEKMLESINEAEAKDGFLSRFIPIFYEGTLGYDNYNQLDEFPPHVAQTFSTLLAIVNRVDQTFAFNAMGGDALVKVAIDTNAQRIMSEFNQASRNIARRAQDDKDELPEIYVALSRIGMTAQRMAVVCAVMDNVAMPVIRQEHVLWAIQFVAGRTVDVIRRMEAGEIGQGDSIELRAIVATVKKLSIRHKKGLVPSSELHNNLRSRAPFRSIQAAGGPMRAIKYALDNMVSDSMVERIVEDSGKQGRPITGYVMNDHKCWD